MKDKNFESHATFQPVDSVMKSIYSEELIPIGIDFTDVGIDNLFELSYLNNVPIVKTIYNLSKVSLAIREKYLLKKILIFINDFNQGNVNPEELERRRKAANNNEQWLMKEIELLTIYLDRFDDLKKSKIAAAFYIEYINENITWQEYREYLAIIERVFPQDFIQLLNIYKPSLQKNNTRENTIGNCNGEKEEKIINELNCDRLIAVGLVRVVEIPVLNGVVKEYYLTKHGSKFSTVLMRIEK